MIRSINERLLMIAIFQSKGSAACDQMSVLKVEGFGSHLDLRCWDLASMLKKAVARSESLGYVRARQLRDLCIIEKVAVMFHRCRKDFCCLCRPPLCPVDVAFSATPLPGE